MLDSARIKELAHEIGFDLCGICSADPIPEAKQALASWLGNGYQAEMDYLTKEPNRRSDPKEVLENAKSVIMLGLNYYFPDMKPELPEGHGLVARYARGKDYHRVMERKLKALCALIEIEKDDPPQLKYMVDYGPFLERSYAERAGLGFIGKNSMLINRKFGSYFVLAEIITDLELDPDEADSTIHGRCGSCTKCIDACPTDAIVSDGIIDSSLCISYLTIERPISISDTLSKQIRPRLLGCDVCQDVCPHNGRAIITQHKEFMPESGVGVSLDASEILKIKTREEFLDLTAGTPLTRPKLEGLKQNARIVLDGRADEDVPEE